MRRAGMVWAVALAVAMAAGRAHAQSAAAGAAESPAQAAAGAASTTSVAAQGGVLHGVVRSGKTPLPGVTVTAENTLTGKKYATTTDVTGAWRLKIPGDGRYVIRTAFAAFAPGDQEALLNGTGRDRTVDFDLLLASRAAAASAQQEAGVGQAGQAMQAIEQMAGNGAQSLSLMNAMQAGAEPQGGGGDAGAALPSIAGNSDFSGDSVAISGEAGAVSPLAGMDMDRMREMAETLRSQFGGGGGNFRTGGFGRGGGFGGGFGGRRNFRRFNPGQPHGAIFWTGSNSAINADPFSLHGQSTGQPASGTNRFGVVLISAPYLPGVTKPSGKDTVFLSIFGQRSSTPVNEYGTVPTDAERSGEIPGLATAITPVRQAVALLKFFPEPNVANATQNYRLLTTQQSNSTRGGVRYMRGLGSGGTPFGMFRALFGGAQKLTQSIHLNYNWSHAAADDVNLFPELGGKNSSDSDSVQAGYTVSYHKLTSIFNAGWNRSSSRTTNFFTNGTDIATGSGILGPGGAALNASPLNYGVPNVVLSEFSGLSQQQPNLSVQQTISISETLSWMRGKHYMRFGGDYRRVHHDFLGGSNSTGTFYFTGSYTGSALGDFLLGEAQETSIDAAVTKSYLRENVFDLYAVDDWRARSNVTLNYGVRYEFFAPYTEKSNHLAFVDTNATGGFTQAAEVEAGQAGPFSGNLPDALVFPFRLGIAPRVGIAVRLPKDTVVRAGFGMNFTNSQYATFATTMAHEPPFANEQTNQASTVGALTLADGFPAPAATGDYAVDPHYTLPYVEVWNLDVQKALPWGVVMNLGYNGSKGNHLDITSAPGRAPDGTSYSGVLFNYEQAAAFSKFNAGTLRLNKRLRNGLALGADYQYSHSIDDAGSVGGTSTVVAQNWQDLGAEEGNSSFDQRHKVSGRYLYELPFGQDKHWITTGKAAHIFEGFSISGDFTFATGAPLTPRYAASAADVVRGTAGTLRPDRVPGVSLTAGAGSLGEWFNTAAFTAPGAKAGGYVYGDASRNSISGPGTVENDMTLSKTMQLGDTRSMEVRATATNVFNTVQYSGVDTSPDSRTFGQVTSTGAMRSFNFVARFRF
ncbi:MAG TPA: carboxypeptidase-like regulatory domain-containing protein [Terracidiphilus sp.]|nr:carboxypeptidase-like regulatory domain-containing protein [Terracidiphilus sp.]